MLAPNSELSQIYDDKISRITTARPMTSKMSLLKILKLQLYHHAECIELVSAPAYYAARPSAHADFVFFLCTS